MKPLWAILPLALAYGCSDSGADPVDAGSADGGVDSGGSVDTGVVLDAGFDPNDSGLAPDAAPPDGGGCVVDPLPDPTPDPNCTADWLTVVKGNVVTAAGQPIEDARAQLCVRSPTDILRCLRPVPTCTGGHFEISVPAEAACVSHGAMRSLLPAGGYATTYCELSVVNPPVVEISADLRLYPTVAALDLPPLGTMTAPRTVKFEGDLEATIVPEDTYAEYTELSAHKLSAGDPSPCFLDGQPAPDGLWAFSPEGDITGNGAAIRFPNSTGLAANTMVRLYVLGGLDCTLDDGTLIPESEWREYGSGQVSADGTVIEGASLPCLTWFGYRAQ